MSIWSRIADALSALSAGEPLSAVFDRLRQPPEHSVGFTIAVIALSAKMAKADGHVTRNEVTAFREVFTIPPEEEANAARVFNLARQDVAGFEEYAQRIARMFRDRLDVLRDLLAGLFHIAMADGTYHEAEEAFLIRVADIFGLSDRDFARIRASYVEDAVPDHHDVLGLPEGASLEEARAAWRKIVRDYHPDQLVARGLPEEAIRIGEARIIDANRAWEAIKAAAEK